MKCAAPQRVCGGRLARGVLLIASVVCRVLRVLLLRRIVVLLLRLGCVHVCLRAGSRGTILARVESGRERHGCGGRRCGRHVRMV